MKNHNINDYKNIAVLQTAFIGDIALTLYLLKAIKKYNSACRITLLTTPIGAQIASMSHDVDAVLSYDKRGLQSGWRGIKYIAGLLREKGTNCIIAPHRSARTTAVSLQVKPKLSIGFDRNALSFIYKERVPYMAHLHEIDRNMKLLSVFGIDENYDSIGLPEIDICNDDKSYVESIMTGPGNFVALAPGSVWETKRWPPEYFAELAKKLTSVGHTPILVGARPEEKLCSDISRETGALNLCGKTTLQQSTYLFSMCKLLVTNDSAPTHLAGLTGCPTLTIFGATVPGFGFAPRGRFDKSVGLNELNCRPCRIHGSRQCPKKHFKCMQDLLPEYVFSKATEILNYVRLSGGN